MRAEALAPAVAASVLTRMLWNLAGAHERAGAPQQAQRWAAVASELALGEVDLER